MQDSKNDYEATARAMQRLTKELECKALKQGCRCVGMFSVTEGRTGLHEGLLNRQSQKTWSSIWERT